MPKSAPRRKRNPAGARRARASKSGASVWEEFRAKWGDPAYRLKVEAVREREQARHGCPP